MHAEIETRIADRGRKREERGRCARLEGGEDGRAREAHRRMPGRKRGRARHRHERVEASRPVLPDHHLHDRREPPCDRVGEEDENERPRAATPQRERRSNREPHRAPAADAREPDEDVVERDPAMLDDPAFDPMVQSGTSCFVRSMSCCRSNGLPTKACAPRLVACCSARSSTLPLNMTTGIAPTP